MKRMLSIMLIVAVAFLACFNTAGLTLSQDSSYENKETVFGRILLNDKIYEKSSSIELSIYKMENISKDNGVESYKHIFYEKIIPNEIGSFSFVKPTKNCYIEIDNNQLPDGVGVINNGQMLTDDNKVDFLLYTIDSFDFDIFTQKVTFFNQSKNEILTNSKYSINYEKNIVNDALTNKKINVECKFDGFSKSFTKNLENYSDIDIIDFLLKDNLINEDYRNQLYLEELQSQELNENEHYKCISLLAGLQQNNLLSEELDMGYNEYVQSSRPVFQNEATYTNDFFTLHYDANKISLYKIKLLYSYFNFTKVSLCSTYHFCEPAFEPGESTYQVYITTDLNSSVSGLIYYGVYAGVPYSYIVINVPNPSSDISLYTLGSTCHEFTHAIQKCYNTGNPTSLYRSEMVHYNEAVANMVNNLLVPNSEIDGFVSRFQNSPEFPLLSSTADSTDPYQYRCYGALLFPMYIAQEFNNLNTIREIYEENIVTQDVYDSINNVLALENSSFSEAYTKCMMYNYNLQYNYLHACSTWQTSPKFTNYFYYPVSRTLTNLSSNYYNVTGPRNRTFVISFGNTNQYENIEIQRIDTINDELVTSSYPATSSNITFVINIPSNQTTCILLSNKSITNSISFNSWLG